ncbi:MAG TPA: Ig domain-containing protein [Thermoguttaceae bacterium]|nr:Ig domain-containing protein [Thermoguttaceae bacterium]
MTRSHEDSLLQSTRSHGRQTPLLIAVAVVLALVVIGLGLALWLGGKEPLVLEPIDDLTVDELDTLEFAVEVENAGKAAGRLQYTLDGAPEGARIDPGTGAFTWCPSEEQGPDRYEMTVRAAAPGTRTTPAAQRFTVDVGEVQQPPVLEPIEEQTVEPGGTLAFRVRAEDPDVPSYSIRFRLGPNAPPGARVNPASGQFEWTPQEVEPGQAYEITVLAAEDTAESLTAERTFRVRIETPADMVPEDPDQAIDRLVDELRGEGVEVAVSSEALSHPPLSGKLRLLSIDGKRVGVFGYATARAAASDAQGVSRDDLEPFAKSGAEPSPAYLFQRGRLIAFYAGRDANLLNLLDGRLGRPAVAKTIEVMTPAEKTPDEVAKADEEADRDAGDAIVLELHEKNKLLSKTEYPTLRKVFADRFEREHRDQIEEAFGGPEEEIRRWLDEHVDVKEEFYLAIDPEHDDVPQVLTLFKELKDRFPEKFESYANLAIAVAVVWDIPKGAIHGSPRGQHSSLPPQGEVGPIENFQYFLDTEDVMQGRAQLLPWEFLVHMVNHRTPLNERQWALMMYLPKRSMFGKCYDEVPYDDGMLQGSPPKLEGKVHTLPNILRFGGVCSCRADFAGRVGKSIGVPAFSVSGESRFGQEHPWVMWVELGRITPTGLTFTLESHGRFRYDHYYKGNLHDPQTGEPTTDRDVERRLHAVGMDPLAKHHADLVMRAYPMLRERLEMDTTKQLDFLSRVIDLSPGNEEAWIALAKMSREGQITKTNSKPMMRVLEGLFTTFARLPDFTWVVFDDLVSFQDLPKQRAALFGRLAALYEQAGRPDLSCEARLKYAEYLVADERQDDAIRGLAAGILLFPEEGNFVPKMLDRLEELCKGQREAKKHLAPFYQQFLPAISPKRGSRASDYCMEMYQRGIQRFRDAGLDDLAQAYQAQLAALQGQRGG